MLIPELLQVGAMSGWGALWVRGCTGGASQGETSRLKVEWWMREQASILICTVSGYAFRLGVSILNYVWDLQEPCLETITRKWARGTVIGLSKWSLRPQFWSHAPLEDSVVLQHFFVWLTPVNSPLGVPKKPSHTQSLWCLMSPYEHLQWLDLYCIVIVLLMHVRTERSCRMNLYHYYHYDWKLLSIIKVCNVIIVIIFNRIHVMSGL